jgi:hypothetical protein
MCVSASACTSTTSIHSAAHVLKPRMCKPILNYAVGHIPDVTATLYTVWSHTNVLGYHSGATILPITSPERCSNLLRKFRWASLLLPTKLGSIASPTCLTPSNRMRLRSGAVVAYQAVWRSALPGGVPSLPLLIHALQPSRCISCISYS